MQSQYTKPFLATVSMDRFLFEEFSTEEAKDISPEIVRNKYKKALSASRQQPKEEKKDTIEYQKDAGLYHYMKQVVHFEKNGDAKEQTNKLLTLLGDTHFAINYLIKYTSQHRQTKTPIHDACLFKLPKDSSKCPLSFWQKLARKHLDEKRFIILLERADEIQDHASFDISMNIEALLKILPRLMYGEYKDEYKQAADIFQKFNISKNVFEKYITLKPIDDEKQIPNLLITLKEDKSVYTIEKLSSYDPRAAILGHITGCCQSLEKEGESCVEYGITHPNSGFYIVTNKSKEIVAQTWAWRTNNQIVFDSIEANEAVFKDKENLLIFLFRTLADEIVKSNSGITHVLVGTGGRTPTGLGINLERTNTAIELLDYNDYRDSHNQRAISVTLEDVCDIMKLPYNTSEEKLFKSIRTIKEWTVFVYFIKSNVDILSKYWHDLVNMCDKIIIEDISDLSEALSILSQEQCEEILILLKNRLQTIIQSANDFENFLKNLSIKQRTEVYLALKDYIFSMIKSIRDINNITKFITTEEREEVMELINGYLFSHFIKNGDDLSRINLSYFNLEQRSIFYKKVKDQFSNIFKSADDFYDLIRSSSKEDISEYITICGERWLEIFNSPERFNELIFEHLDDEEANLMFETLKNHFHVIIKSAEDLKNMLEIFTPEQQQILRTSFNSHWGTILKSGDSVNYMNFSDAKFSGINISDIQFISSNCSGLDFRNTQGIEHATFKDCILKDIRIDLSYEEMKKYKECWNKCSEISDKHQLREFIKKIYPTEPSFHFYKKISGNVETCLLTTSDDKSLFNKLREIWIHNITGTFAKVLSFIKEINDEKPFAAHDTLPELEINEMRPMASRAGILT
jgi:hypothetical protein